jgi:hypothetical protein
MSVRANSAFRNRFVRSSQEGANLGLVAIVFLLPLNIYIIYDIFLSIIKEHIANIEQIMYIAPIAIAQERGNPNRNTETAAGAGKQGTAFFVGSPL